MKKALLIFTGILCVCLLLCAITRVTDNAGTESEIIREKTETETETEVNIEGIDENGGMLRVVTYTNENDTVELIEQNFYYDEVSNEIYRREDIYHFSSEAAARISFGDSEGPGVIIDENVVTLISVDLRDTEHTYDINADNYEEMKYTFEPYRKEDWQKEGTIDYLVELYGNPKKIVVEFIKD